MPDYSMIGWGFLALAIGAAAFVVVAVARIARAPPAPAVLDAPPTAPDTPPAVLDTPPTAPATQDALADEAANDEVR